MCNFIKQIDAANTIFARLNYDSLFFWSSIRICHAKKKNLWALKKKSHATINVVCVCRSKYGRNATYTRRRIHSSTSRAIFRSGLFISIGVSLNPCDDTRRCERQIVSRISHTSCQSIFGEYIFLVTQHCNIVGEIRIFFLCQRHIWIM